MSLQATRAPYRASARAIPLPMLGPAPVTRATLPARDISMYLRPLALSRCRTPALRCRPRLTAAAGSAGACCARLGPTARLLTPGLDRDRAAGPAGEAKRPHHHRH